MPTIRQQQENNDYQEDLANERRIKLLESKPTSILIKPVPDELWEWLEGEKKRITTANKHRKVVSVGERLVNLVKCCTD